MLKRLLAVLLALCLPGCAAAEVDVLALQGEAGMIVFTLPGSADTVIRHADQPFVGELDLEDGELVVFVDYIDMPNENRLFLRLTVSVVVQDMYAADTMTLKVGKKTYAFAVQPEINEYDTIYYEDYAVCLTGKSLAILDDLIKADGKPVSVELSCEGANSVFGSVVIPAADAKDIRQRYERIGGMDQDFGAFEERWPVEIGK